MKELGILSSESMGSDIRSSSNLFLCDESQITCANLGRLKEHIERTGGTVILGIPENQYIKGKRGWAKAQILASMNTQVFAVLPLTYEETLREQENNWNNIEVSGPLVWVQ